MNGKIDVILAAQRAADGLTRTLASVLIQANVPFAATVVAAEDAPLPFAAENARLLRGQGDLLALWRAGLEACEGEWALLLHAGDALFDAYSLWRLADARRENPQAAAVYGAARCFGPDGREARGVDFHALPCGVLARRETLLTALARTKTPFALAASLFAAAEETASISDCACECALPEGWFEQLCGAADGLPGARAGEWAERQLAALYLVAVHMAEVRGQITKERREELIAAMLALPDQIERVLSDKERVQWYANKMAACKEVFFIGRGLDYAISLEGSLKLKEISYIHSEAYAAGELKHGTISLIEDGVLVVAVATQPELFEKEVSNMVEVRSRGASLFGLTTYGQYAIEDTVNFTVYVPRTDPLLATSLAVVPLQLLAYYISCA